MKTKLLRTIRKRFGILSYNQNAGLYKALDYKKKRIFIYTIMDMIDFGTKFRYDDLNEERKFNRAVRKIKKRNGNIK